ncbi:hypothetical protein ACFLVI_01555 [Chloroflexota bacterium]
MIEEYNEKYARPKEIYQRIRCMRCKHKIPLEQGQREVVCPSCGLGWVIAWVTEEIPMVLRRIIPNDSD